MPKRKLNNFTLLTPFSSHVCSCQSFVGRIGIHQQPQGLTLGPGGCVNVRTALHELGHAIGFYHEHTRPDRDEHLHMFMNNVLQDAESQFNKIPEGGSNLLGYGYDHASIMHYDSDYFSRNGQDTMQAKDPTIPFGGAEELSPLDIAKANVLYSCGKISFFFFFSETLCGH